MTDSISSIIARETGISSKHVEATLRLLADGATIPFISRYRKEATGGLDEVAVHAISQRAAALEELAKRKAYIADTISQQGNLTDELRNRINECLDINVLEDIYLPFKPKRRTRAQIAREKGLEPLAKTIMAQKLRTPVEAAARFIGKNVATTDEALQGASDIIAEWINEHEEARSRVRDQFQRFATISAKVIKGKEEEGEKYANWFEFSQPLKRCGSHAYLALRRAEREGILRVSIDVDDDRTISRLLPLFIKRHASPDTAHFITRALTDGYKRLTRPSIETDRKSVV